MGAVEKLPISDLHPLEIELRQLMASDTGMWEFVQQGSLDGVWYWDLEQPDREWMSPEFWRLFGIDPAGKRHDPEEWQDIIFQEDLAVALENFEQHCKDPSHPYDQIVRYRHRDGSTVWVRCRGVAIRDNAGRPIRMLGAHNDLTAVKRAEELALREKTKLEAANEHLRSFAYGVSHDLKSPSRTAKQLIEEALLDSQNMTADQKELLGDACLTLARMQYLVDDLLDYGKVVEQEMQWRDADLVAIVKDVTSDLQSDIQATNAWISIDSLPMVKGHAGQLRMLLQNLISNAIRFRQRDVSPEIRITGSHAANGCFELVVQDNGIGIPREHAERVFDVFTRLHRNDEVPGSGLGLALCKRIALNHNGDIRVAAAPVNGCAFTIRLGLPK